MRKDKLHGTNRDRFRATRVPTRSEPASRHLLFILSCLLSFLLFFMGSTIRTEYFRPFYLRVTAHISSRHLDSIRYVEGRGKSGAARADERA